MIHRLVKLTFQESKVDNFIALFEERKSQIASFPGCRYLELWREKSDGNVFFTYSHWETNDALEAYRKSELFADTWSKTKVLFADKPQAWSLDSLFQSK